ncbi:MAG TPA: peptidyl-prolyl cis-trans isomerase [Chromatiaceae bacterium]|nr:peptidyl-prolyl cis-trans isomerase [Chromatiaceae bacterium]
MNRLLLSLLFALSVGSAALAEPVKVVMETSKGDIELSLDQDKAPISVANFLRYVDEGFYNGTIFHRVISGFMIQGGGMGEDMQKNPTHEPIKNEAKNGLKNQRGSIAMARTGDPHSATTQFFINHKDNTNLDYPSFDGWGYAVFGKVTKGMDVVDGIAATPTAVKNGRRDVPVETILIKSVKRVETK